jgi:tetratricopeptide (TPR) repeat protein
MYLRVIVVLVTLTYGLLLTNLPAHAQDWSAQRTAPLDPSNNPAGTLPDMRPQPGTPPRTEMERAEQQAAAANLPFVPTPEETARQQSGPATVSIQQLSHPLSGKGERLLAKVESYLRRGQRTKAQEQLAQALKEPSAAPYAHAILGTEYLRDGHALAAIPELENAAYVLPIAGIHSNLGFALCMTGQGKRGKQELQEALRLDGDSPKARFLMGVVLLNERSRAREAQYDLRMAHSKVRSAHLALAVCYVRAGETHAAEQQLREYLGADYDTKILPVWQWAFAAALDTDPAAHFGLHVGDSE